MVAAGIRIVLQTYAATDYYTQPGLEFFDAFEEWEREAKTRNRFAWKEPKKRIQVSTVPQAWRYMRLFTGHRFPVGGQKK